MTVMHSFFLFFVMVCQQALITIFRKKKLFQPIYELTPPQHHEKPLTPSLGGIGIVVSTCIGVGWFDLFTPEIRWIVFSFCLFAFIGFLDDILSLKSGKNMGLTARQKMGLQMVFAVISVGVFHIYLLPVSILQGILYGVAFVACSNATNLTDGVDGLLASLSLVTLWGFYTLFISLGLSTELCEFIKIVSLSCIGYLWFNWTPAKIFMGDTGSLGLGALFVALAMIAGNIWILIPFGIVYILETLSVMIQVTWFKRTGKRLFLMSPIHHHFEVLGWSTKQIVGLFLSVQFLSCALFWLLGSMNLK